MHLEDVKKMLITWFGDGIYRGIIILKYAFFFLFALIWFMVFL